MSASEGSRRFAAWMLVTAGLAALALLQAASDAESTGLRQAVKSAAFNQPEPLVPKAAALKALSLGNPSVAADLLWLRTIQYFGSGNPYGSYPSLGPLLADVTGLDPKFEYPYEFGLIVLPFMRQNPAALALGERAQVEIPNNGLLTYYLATDYHLYAKDYRRAATLYRLAATQPGAPSAATTLAGTALDKLTGEGDRLVAQQFWYSVYQRAKDPADKELAKNWYLHMGMVITLEQAAAAYHDATGTYPSSQRQLIDAGLLREELVSPVGRSFSFDTANGTVSFESAG